MYYLSHPPFNTASESTINSIGTIALALQYLETPFVIAFAQKRPKLIRPMQWGALVACAASLAISSFANSVGLFYSKFRSSCSTLTTSLSKAWQLILLQGVVFGVSGGVLYAPIVIFVSTRCLPIRRCDLKLT